MTINFHQNLNKLKLMKVDGNYNGQTRANLAAKI